MNRPSAFAVLAVGAVFAVAGCGGDSGPSHDKAYWDAQRVALFRGKAARQAFARPTAIALVEAAIDTRIAEENGHDLAASGRRFGTATLADAMSFPFVDEEAMTTIFALWVKESAIPTTACQAAVPVVLDGLTVIDDERFPEDDVRFARRSLYKACGIPPMTELVALEIERPAPTPFPERVPVRSSTYLLRGTATPGAEVRIDPDRVARTTSDGRWQLVLRLKPGKNDVVVTATKARMEDSRVRHAQIVRR